MRLGTLYDANGSLLDAECTLDEAVEWLRSFNAGEGWQDGTTAWLMNGADVGCEIADAYGQYRIRW